ncbi:MAG TPA: CDP-alcohol phosphatidyltransferase family protein [Chthoniobacterales bacterium]|nr:CDP-alcohol phosphatidyltransferase family protein [Chthoniobacterales bacterium]
MSKPQDGFVSRVLNRPVSRRITHVLLRFRIHPNVWTVSILFVPVVGCFFLLRGDYSSIVIGAALFQFYSILDGCDGEIARAKNLESRFGEFLDNFCDHLASILFVVALGFGIHRASEGIICAVAIAGNELSLAINQSHTSVTSPALYLRHRRMIDHSGLRQIGDRVVWWIMQLTKRDVAILFFLLLAVAGAGQWILHLWTTVAAVGLLFALIARVRAP